MRTAPAGPLVFAFAALAFAACGQRGALNSAVTSHPAPDAAFQPYVPPDAGVEVQVVAPKLDASAPTFEAGSTFEVSPAFEAGAIFEVSPAMEVGPIIEVRDAAASACPVSDIPEGKFTSVSAGNGSSCAVRADGALRCWGNLLYPQTQIPTGAFSRVAVGLGACGVRATGELACWGSGSSSALPNGPFADVGRGEEVACALRTVGGIACWRSGDGLSFSPPVGFESMSQGAYFICAVSKVARDAFCWDPRVNDSLTMTSGPFAQLSTGRFYACGLLMDHTARCWPQGITGTNIGAPPPGPFREISAGEFTACVLKDDGSPICWGSNQWGVAEPPAGARFQHISVGSTHACGILLDGTLACWGSVPDPCAPG